jgi:hypothetical protein
MILSSFPRSVGSDACPTHAKLKRRVSPCQSRSGGVAYICVIPAAESRDGAVEAGGQPGLEVSTGLGSETDGFRAGGMMDVTSVRP